MHVFIKDEVQWLLNMAGCCKRSCGTVVRTGVVTRYNFPFDISLWYAFGKNLILMMWTQKSNKKIVSISIGVLFPSIVWWESYHENGKINSSLVLVTPRIFLFVIGNKQKNPRGHEYQTKEIRSDLNWSINLVNILMYVCSLIKSVFVILCISYFPHCSVSVFATFQKNTIWYVFCHKYSAGLMRDADIYHS